MLVYNTIVQMGPSDYRMYYDTGWTMENRDDFHRYTALATSTDGENWVKPNLGIANFNNSRKIAALFVFQFDRLNDCSEKGWHCRREQLDLAVSRHDIAAIWVAFFSGWQRYHC